VGSADLLGIHEEEPADPLGRDGPLSSHEQVDAEASPGLAKKGAKGVEPGPQGNPPALLGRGAEKRGYVETERALARRSSGLETADEVGLHEGELEAAEGVEEVEVARSHRDPEVVAAHQPPAQPVDAVGDPIPEGTPTLRRLRFFFGTDQRGDPSRLQNFTRGSFSDPENL
jgi:hypothetical protein